MSRHALTSSAAAVLALCAAIGAAHADPAAPDDATAADHAGASAAVATDLSTVVISGNRQTAASSGTKTDTPLLVTPQSITVITRGDLDVRGVSNLNQALRYTAGITPETRGANAENYDLFKLRGFDAPQYLDGLRVFISPTGYAATQVDTSRLDRVEVVKGPASVLYGQSSPGGLIAMTSRMAQPGLSGGSVEATVGTYDLYRLDGDVAGALSQDGSIRYRVDGTANGAHTQQSFGNRQRDSVSPSILFGAGGPTTLTLLANVSHDPRNGNYGVAPLLGTLDPNPNGVISTKFADGEPALQKYARQQESLTYIATHRLNSDWAIRLSGRYQRVDADAQGTYTTGNPTDDTLTTFGRGLLRTNESLYNWTFDNQVAGTIVTGAVAHHLLFGLDQQTARARENAGFDFTSAVSPINAYAPVYGTVSLPPSIEAFPYHADYLVRQRQTGVYAQDQIDWGGAHLTASGRYDHTRGDLDESVGGTAQTKSDHQFTYRLGGLYLFDSGIAPYASLSTSFEPQSTLVQRSDGTSGIADPSVGRQVEGGVKFQPPGTAVLLTAALFRIEQTNVVVSSPITFASTQSGKVQSQGVEFEAKVPLAQGLDLTANYSHQQVRTLQDDNPLNVGYPLIGVGKENAGLFANYVVPAGTLAGVNVGGGVRYVGGVYGGYTTNADGSLARRVDSPAYTLVDATAGVDLARFNPGLRGLRLAVNATNLFDKRHITSCYVNGVQWCWYGQERTVQATLGYQW